MPKKYVLMLAILPILCFFAVSLTNFAFATLDQNKVITVNPGDSIQKAINNADEGDTIIVENGIYHEWHISVNKTLTIIGRTMENTIIDGNGTADVIFHVTASNVVIENFALQNTKEESQGTAIRIYRTKKVKVNRVVARNNFCGIEICSSNFTNITHCQISNNIWGVYLHDKSLNNTFTGNTVTNNKIGINLPDYNSQYNLFYYNNFVNNTNQISTLGGENYFDNGYPCGGNYWSDHASVQDLKHGLYQNETGSDGILDERYANAPDNYPFAYPLTFIEISIVGEHFQVVASTNSTLNSYEFSPQTKSLRLSLSGIGGTVGVCRITIPKELLSCDQLSQWNITLSNEKLNCLVIEDAGNTYLYFTYNQFDNIEVEVQGTKAIPELSNVFTLLVLMGLTTFTIVKFERILLGKSC